MSEKSLGTLFGPAAMGKDTVLNALSADSRYLRIVNTTTRQPRAGEIDGRDYYFVTVAQHQALVQSGAYLTANFAHGRYYGVERRELQEAWDTGRMPIGHFGSENHSQLWESSDAGELALRSVALTTKDFASWHERMQQRLAQGLISEEELYLRAQAACEELAFISKNIGRFVLVLSEVVAPTVETVDRYLRTGVTPPDLPFHAANLAEDFEHFLHIQGREDA